MKKILLITLSIFLSISIVVAVVYFVRKPSTITSLPTPTPMASFPNQSAAPVDIMAVDPNNACRQTFVVVCSSDAPHPSVSSAPSNPPSASLDCVTKRMYSDDSRNRSGFYYLQNELLDTNTIQNGQIIVYNVSVKNNGGNSAPDTTITDTLSSSLTYVDGDSGCSYDSSSRVVTCTVGALSSGAEAQRSFRARVSASGTISVANTADVTSSNGQRDSCSVRIDATGRVTTTASPAPTALPVAGVFEVTALPLGMGILLLILGGLGLLLI